MRAIDPNRLAVALVLATIGSSLGCKPQVADSATRADAGATLGSGGASSTGSTGGHGGSSTSPAGGGGAPANDAGNTAGQGGNGGAAGGSAGGAGAVCENPNGWTVPKPGGYDLASFQGSVEGLCDAAESIGCNVTDFNAGEAVVCSPSYDGCCFAYALFEPEACGWVDCDFDAACDAQLAKDTWKTKEPVCHFCAADSDCAPYKQVCSIRVGDRMICGPP